LAEKGLDNVIQLGLGDRVTVEGAVIHWLGRPGIEYRGLTIRKAGEQTGWLLIKRVVIRPELRSLFSESIRWKSLDLDHPVLRLSGGGGRFSPESLASMLSRFDHLKVKGAKIVWPDREIEELSVSLGNLSTDGPFSLVLRGAMKAGDASPARVSVRGLVHNLSKKWDPSSLRLSVEIQGEELDPFWFGRPFARYIPSGLVESRLTLTAKYDGDLRGRFQSSGTVSLIGSGLIEETGRLTADFTVNWDGQELEIQKIRLKDPSIPLEGRGRIYRKQGADPVISFQANCPWVSIGEWGRTFPLFPEMVRSFLGSVQGGQVALDSVGFRGHLRTLGFPKDEESLLQWKGGARFRNLTILWKEETVALKRGSVKLDHGRIVAEAVSLKLGGSELEISQVSLSEAFSQQSLDLALMGEVSLPDIPKWISMGLIPEAMVVPVSDIEVLSGRGDVHLRVEKSLGLLVPPVLNGRLALQDVTIGFGQLPGAFQVLKGILEFSSGDLVVRDVQGTWKASTVSANGSVSALFSQHPEIDFSLKGHLNLGDLAEFGLWEGIPRDARLIFREIASPSGEADYSLAMKSAPGVPEDIDFKGELSVRDGSFRLWNAYPVNGVKGRIFFSRYGISIPDLRGTWKNSNMALKVSLAPHGRTFLRDLTFSADFDLRDIASERFDHGWPRTWKRFVEPFDFQRGKALLEVTNQKSKDRATVEGKITFEEATVRYRPVFPPLTRLKGTVSFDEKGLGILDIQGRLDSSLLTIQGNLRPDSGDSAPYLSIQADKIDWEKVLLWPWTKGVSHGKKARPPLRVHVRVDRGSFRKVPLSDVEARLTLKGDRVSFEKLTFVSARGHGLITGWIGFEKDDELSFEFEPYLVNLEASPILTSFQRGRSKNDLTGLGSASGIIRGRGKGLQEVARSLSGEVRISLGEGRVARFNILSKVFSILDLSQLLRGKVQDLKTEGMSYRTITGNITLREGSASTSDLLLDSDSMKISVVGSLDIPSGGLDLKLGIGRIGVGGKIVRAVPFFGEIVTNDRGSFINYYLEAKGTLAEPEVKGIPLESLREGIFGTLKKLFEKPAEVFPVQRQPDFDQYFEDRENRYPYP